MPGDVFLETFRRFTDKPVHLEQTAVGALKKALELKGGNDRLFIAGSLYLVGEVKRIIGGLA